MSYQLPFSVQQVGNTHRISDRLDAELCCCTDQLQANDVVEELNRLGDIDYLEEMLDWERGQNERMGEEINLLRKQVKRLQDKAKSGVKV